MSESEFSEHAREMLKERGIQESWVKKALDQPETKTTHDDGTVHYTRAIEEFGGRHLRVIVNPDIQPQKVVTQFFDRRLRRSS